MPLDRYKWMDAIFPYVKSEQIFLCPSDRAFAQTNVHAGNGNLPYVYYKNWTPAQQYTNTGQNGSYGSYAINAYYGSGGGGMGEPSTDNLSRLQDPSGTIWVADAYRYSDYPDHGYEFCFGENESPPFNFFDDPSGPGRAALTRYGAAVTERHLDFTNVLFADGHVKSLKEDAITKRSTSGNNAFAAWSLDND